jgi:hypothetical protein
MANTQLTADGYAISVWFGLTNYAVDPKNPTAAEVNATRDLSCEISWSNWSFGAQASNQISDAYLCDVGNTQTRGLAQFGGVVSLAYPSQYADLTDSTAAAFAALSQPGTVGYVIIRVDGRKTTSGNSDAAKAAVNGDFISVYRVQSDGYTDQVTGSDLGSFKYDITWVPRGEVYVNTRVGVGTVGAPAPIGTANYASPSGKTPMSAYFTDRRLASVSGQWDGYPGAFNWTSSAPAVASVDANGVVRALAAGTATSITATHKITGTVSTALVIATT